MQQVILTRNAEDGEKTATILRARGFDPILAPLFDIVPIPTSLPEGTFDAVIATSRHALRLLSAADLAKLNTTPLYCVGAATADTAQQLGFATVITGSGTAAGLAEQIRRERKAGEVLLFLTGDPHRPELQQALAPYFDLTLSCLYRSQSRTDFPTEALQNIADPAPIWLHFSLKSAERAAVLIEKTGYGAYFYQGRHVALSQTICDFLEKAGCETCLTAKEPSLDALLSRLDELRPTQA